LSGLKENPFSPVYCSSKAGIVAFSKSLAVSIHNVSIHIYLVWTHKRGNCNQKP